MSNNLHHLENLLRMVADKDATIDRQAAQLVEYAKMLDDERAAVSVLRESIVQLRAQLDAVPIAQLRRQYSIEPMTVHDFGLDAQDVDAWLRSLDGDA